VSAAILPVGGGADLLVVVTITIVGLAWLGVTATRFQRRRRLRTRLTTSGNVTLPGGGPGALPGGEAGAVPGTASAGGPDAVSGGGPDAVAGGEPAGVPGTAAVLGGVGMVTAWVAIGPHAAVALAALAAAGPVRARVGRRTGLRRRREQQLPAALDRLAAALRTGSSLTTALDEVGRALEPPLGPELATLAREASHGRPLRQVLDGWSAGHDDPGTRLAAAALVLATVVGSAPARAIDGVAATLRERHDLTAERRALAAQARISALVLSVAPVAFAALLVMADTAAAQFLVGTPAGWACLAAGVGLDATGAWWMARLSRGDGW
jgi:tight adherence protein B